MAEQQMHQQQLKALHDDLQTVRVSLCNAAYMLAVPDEPLVLMDQLC